MDADSDKHGGDAPAGRVVLHDYVTRDELAAELGYAPRTLERWERERTGPPSVRLGVTTYYHVPTVRAWLTEQMERRAGSRAARQRKGRRT